MKKNIEIIATSADLLKYLKDITTKNKTDLLTMDEFNKGISHLLSGETTSLLLETEKNSTNQAYFNEISVKGLTIYPLQRKVLKDEKEVFLTPKEFDILYFLITNKGEVFTKEQIYKAVWDDNYLLDDSNIMAFIRKLRKKIEPNPDSPIYILTIWGVGYKFNDKI